MKNRAGLKKKFDIVTVATRASNGDNIIYYAKSECEQANNIADFCSTLTQTAFDYCHGKNADFISVEPGEGRIYFQILKSDITAPTQQWATWERTHKPNQAGA